MPNLNPPVRGCEDALAYRERIMAALPPGCDFEPLMTLYLTDNTRVEDIEAASASPFIHGAKLYPAGATTNSDFGVTDLSKLGRVFEAMQQHGFMLQLHGEATAPEVDVFDREKVFIEQSLERIRRDFPELRIVFEHITTRDAVDYVRAADTNLGATITPHHLLINRNAIFQGGQPQRHFSGRHSASLLLPADCQTRAAPPGAGRSGRQRRESLLRRHRQRAPQRTGQGVSLRLRGYILGAQRARTVRGSVRSGWGLHPFRILHEPQRRGLLRLAAKPGQNQAQARSVDPARLVALSRCRIDPFQGWRKAALETGRR
jgi:hypothetical protein